MRDIPVIQVPSSFEDAAALLEETNQDSLIAVTDGRLVGTVLSSDVHEALAEQRRDLSGLISRDVPTCSIEESLDDALRKMAPRDLRVPPVVDPHGMLLGSVSREAIFRAYGTALAEEERGAGPPPG
jgi:CBS domain-containing protein